MAVCTIHKGDLCDKGFFYSPAIVDQVPEGALAATEETFGRLAAVLVLDGVAEAVRVANARPFGLAAYVFSGDLERGWSLAEKIEADPVGVNVNDTSELHAPFGGWKMSGMGREPGSEGYLPRKKHIKLRLRSR